MLYLLNWLISMNFNLIQMNAVLNPAFYLQQGAINKVKQETAEYLLECVKAANHPGSGQ